MLLARESLARTMPECLEFAAQDLVHRCDDLLAQCWICINRLLHLPDQRVFLFRGQIVAILLTNESGGCTANLLRVAHDAWWHAFSAAFVGCGRRASAEQWSDSIGGEGDICADQMGGVWSGAVNMAVSYTNLRAHETRHDLV